MADVPQQLLALNSARLFQSWTTLVPTAPKCRRPLARCFLLWPWGDHHHRTPPQLLAVEEQEEQERMVVDCHRHRICVFHRLHSRKCRHLPPPITTIKCTNLLPSLLALTSNIHRQPTVNLQGTVLAMDNSRCLAGEHHHQPLLPRINKKEGGIMTNNSIECVIVCLLPAMQISLDQPTSE